MSPQYLEVDVGAFGDAPTRLMVLARRFTILSDKPSPRSCEAMGKACSDPSDA